jgi:C1A family cysteine protease
MPGTTISFGGREHTVNLSGYLRDTAAAPESSLQTYRSSSDLPERVDLRELCSPVENQGSLGSCTANAAVGALELLLRKTGAGAMDLSRLFVYYNTRRLRGDIMNDTGATIAECMAALLAYGAPDETLWPYSDTHLWQTEPPDEIYQQALFLENLQYTRVAPGAGVQAALAAEIPVCFGIFLPSSVYEMAANNGDMSIAGRLSSTADAGGHAMLIVGYDQLRSHYIVRNSWGEAYGDGGYLYIPYELMDACAHKESFWVVGHLQQHGFLSVNHAGSDRVQQARDSFRSGLEGQMLDARRGLRDRLTRK